MRNDPVKKADSELSTKEANSGGYRKERVLPECPSPCCAMKHAKTDVMEQYVLREHIFMSKSSCQSSG